MDGAITIAEALWTRVKAAASIKAKGGLSYTDAFTVALSKELGALLLTGDPEIIAKAEDVGIKVLVF